MMGDGIFGFVAGFIAGIILGAISFGMSLNAAHQSNLIARDLAQYCPADGHFAFKGECDK